MKRFIFSLLTIVSFLIIHNTSNAQTGDSLLQQASLQACVQYALTHQPVIKQSLIDEQITERMIKGKLADWYPQINFDYNLEHYFKLQTAVFAGNTVTLGSKNTSFANLSFTQNIFDRDVLLASSSAKDVRRQSQQTTTNNKINLAVNVSKAFYDVLLNRRQIRLLDSDIVLLQKSLDIALSQYQSGVVDKVDYKRATITLNNANARRKTFVEQIKGKYAYLKELMGYPSYADLPLYYDSVQLQQDAFIDTNQTINYESRIEYQLLQTQKRLREDNLKYYKWAYIPSISAFGNYNLNFFSREFGKLYSQNYPLSYAGLSLNFPIFQGMKRKHEIKQAQLELQRVDYDILAFKNSVNTEYEQAIATYKSSLNNYNILKDNLTLAEDVFNTIQMQYKAGVKTYLDVIVSQNDLISAQVNYLDALYQLLTSKLDVQKALGQITY
jgi:outer membrane protein TolC